METRTTYTPSADSLEIVIDQDSLFMDGERIRGTFRRPVIVAEVINRDHVDGGVALALRRHLQRHRWIAKHAHTKLDRLNSISRGMASCEAP